MTSTATHAAHARQLREQQPPVHVLVVDDYAEVRAVVTKLLTSAGYAVDCAASGEEALRTITADPHAISLLLTDLNMSPGMWGDELVRQARKHTPALRVVMMTGQSDQLSAQAQLAWLNVSLLPKPFRPAELLHAVQMALGGDRMPMHTYTSC